MAGGSRPAAQLGRRLRPLRQLDRAPLVHGSVHRLHRSPVQMRAADSIADELRRLPGDFPPRRAQCSTVRSTAPSVSVVQFAANSLELIGAAVTAYGLFFAYGRTATGPVGFAPGGLDMAACRRSRTIRHPGTTTAA